jgi:PAS domain-containing protein
MNEELLSLNDELAAKNEQLEELSLLAVHSHEVVITTNPEQQILWVNKAFTTPTEYTLEEVRGRKPNFLQGVNTDLLHIQALREGVTRKQPFF